MKKVKDKYCVTVNNTFSKHHTNLIVNLFRTSLPANVRKNPSSETEREHIFQYSNMRTA